MRYNLIMTGDDSLISKDARKKHIKVGMMVSDTTATASASERASLPSKMKTPFFLNKDTSNRFGI